MNCIEYLRRNNSNFSKVFQKIRTFPSSLSEASITQIIKSDVIRENIQTIDQYSSKTGKKDQISHWHLNPPLVLLSGTPSKTVTMLQIQKELTSRGRG